MSEKELAEWVLEYLAYREKVWWHINKSFHKAMIGPTGIPRYTLWRYGEGQDAAQ